MIVIPGRIPIAIHPIFWLFAAIIGWLNSPNFVGILVWVGVIFFSVLFHEFGHALSALVFKQKAKIQLVALGGLTSYEGPKLKFWQQFLIVLNGPLFGFLLFVFATLLLRYHWEGHPILYTTLKITQFANLFWTVVNLLPVMPLDGGQLLRIVLEACFGVKGFKATLFIGGLISTLIALGFILIGAILIGAIFFLFAFQSFASWRRSRFATKADRSDETRELIIKAERALQEGRKEEAKSSFEKIRELKDEGMMHRTATQYLALLLADEGKKEEAYELLLSVKDHLSEEIRPLLHKLAAEHQNYELVARFSQECYQLTQSQETALQNARAFAHLNQPKHAGGWLQTAWQFGGLDLNRLLNEEAFQHVKSHPEFKQFTDQMLP